MRNLIDTLAVVQKPNTSTSNMNIIIILVIVIIVILIINTVFSNKK